MSRRITGLSAIAFAIAFNIPYALLTLTYSYPDILRRPAAEALDRFHAGGPELVLTWYGFVLAALAFVPLSMAISVTPGRLRRAPALALGALVAGSLAGITQAIGLMRWVFVVPDLARRHADPEATAEALQLAEHSFSLLNLYGGVAIGEHLGQMLTALFIGLLSVLQSRENQPVSAALGYASAAAVLLGTGEGLMLSLGASGELFSMLTIAGFLGLTVWLIATGLGLLRRPAQDDAERA